MPLHVRTPTLRGPRLQSMRLPRERLAGHGLPRMSATLAPTATRAFVAPATTEPVATTTALPGTPMVAVQTSSGPVYTAPSGTTSPGARLPTADGSLGPNTMTPLSPNVLPLPLVPLLPEPPPVQQGSDLPSQGDPTYEATSEDDGGGGAPEEGVVPDSRLNGKVMLGLAALLIGGYLILRNR